VTALVLALGTGGAESSSNCCNNSSSFTSSPPPLPLPVALGALLDPASGRILPDPEVGTDLEGLHGRLRGGRELVLVLVVGREQIERGF
jgi:hypothetical protein